MQDKSIFTIEDVRKLAEQKQIPKHIIETFLSELDAEGNVVDSHTIEARLQEFIYDLACTNLLKDPEFIKEIKAEKEG